MYWVDIDGIDGFYFASGMSDNNDQVSNETENGFVISKMFPNMKFA